MPLCVHVYVEYTHVYILLGLRKLRVKAKKRTFEQWKSFIQQQIDIILASLPVFTHSNYVEVQERVSGNALYCFCCWRMLFFIVMCCRGRLNVMSYMHGLIFDHAMRCFLV